MLLLKQILNLSVILILFCSGCATHPAPDFILLPDKLPPAPPLTNIRVALVLSGGGARALAHVGVLEVLEKHGIPIDLIVGSSSGSVIGAMYADDPNAQRLKQKIITLKRSDLLDLNWTASVKMLWRLTGLVEGNALRRFAQDNISARHFDALHIPLAVVTTDLHRGKTFVIRSGPLAPALQASSAVPMVFTPVRMYGRTLVDGGVASPMPVEVAQSFKPKLVIAVDIGTSPDYGKVKNGYQLAMRSLHISYFTLANWQAQQADIVIHPAIDEYDMFADYANNDLYQAGKVAALKMLPHLQQALAKINRLS